VAAAPAIRCGSEISASAVERAKAAPPAKRSDSSTWLRLASACASGCVRRVVPLPIGVVRIGAMPQSRHSTYGV